MAVDTAQLMPVETDRKSLLAWFNLYMSVEVGEPDSNTFKAKKADLERFLEYFRSTLGCDDVDLWSVSTSKGFLNHLLRAKSERTGEKLAPSTINRVLATLRNAARWIHKHRPFPAGFPLERVKDIQLSEPTWKGLSDADITRLKVAADQLEKIQTRSMQQPARDQAMLLVLLGTALRASELLGLDFSQYEGKHFKNVKRKGNHVTSFVFIPQDAREGLDRYVKDVRGSAPGPLFQSRTGKALAPQNLAEALARIADQANARLPEGEQIHLHPHILRHTALRRMAERKGIRFAQQMAGHASTKYIWRYVRPSEDEMEQALEDLF